MELDSPAEGQKLPQPPFGTTQTAVLPGGSTQQPKPLDVVVADDSKPVLQDPSSGEGERVLLCPPRCF